MNSDSADDSGSGSLLRRSLGILVWLALAGAVLPGYIHTEIFYVNIYDPGAWISRLEELGIILAAVIPLTLLLSGKQTHAWRARCWTKIRETAPASLPDRLVLAVSIITGVLLSVYGWKLWVAVPRIPDSLAYLFQAKIFAAGRLWAPVPDMVNRFDYMFTLITGDRWISRYSPGFPLLLAAGYKLAVPWAVSPVFAGIAVWLMYRLYQVLYSGRWSAMLAALLTATSPYFLGVSGQILTHSAALVFYLLFILSGWRAVQTGRRKYGLVSGLSAGFFFLIRQLTAVTLCTPFVLAFTVMLLRRRHRSAVLALMLGGCLMGGLQMMYNTEFTGHPFEFPFHQGEFGRLDRMGFNHRVKWDVWPEPGVTNPVHTPAKAMKNIHLCLSRLNRSLFAWPASLMFIPLAWFGIRRRGSLWDLLFSCAGVFMIAGYALYWFPGAGLLGARYYYEAIPVFVCLSVRGMQVMSGCVRAWSARRFTAFVPLLVAGSTIHGAVMFWPDHAELTWDAFVNPFGRVIAAMADKPAPALVFISGSTTEFSAGFFANDIFLKGPVIYARDRGPAKNLELIARYPERTPSLYQHDPMSDRLVRLDMSGRIMPGDLAGFQTDTAVQERFSGLKETRWLERGRGRSLITVGNGRAEVVGMMPQDVAPGASADLVYRDLPLATMELSAEFTAPVSKGFMVTLGLDNGRYLDDFQDLTSVNLSFTHREDPPGYLLNHKGLGFRWDNQWMPAFGDESLQLHQLRLTLDAATLTVHGYVDDHRVGTVRVPFRSSILKARLSVFHDGTIKRPVHVIWKSFRITYPGHRSGEGVAEFLTSAGRE